MFNHYTEDYDNNDLILFNSYLGMNYLLRVSNKKKDKIIKFFSQPVILKEAIMEDPDLKYLTELGYFVDSSVNEKHLREVLLNKLKADGTLRLVIHTSKSCNFRCKYCYLYFNNQGETALNISKDTQDGIINFVKKNINNYKAVHVDWFGGEPLLDIKAIEYISEKLISICAKARKPYEAVVTTNG